MFPAGVDDYLAGTLVFVKALARIDRHFGSWFDYRYRYRDKQSKAKYK